MSLSIFHIPLHYFLIIVINVSHSSKTYMLIFHYMIFKSLLLTANREADVLFEVLFDEEFPGGLTIRFVFPDDNYTL